MSLRKVKGFGSGRENDLNPLLTPQFQIFCELTGASQTHCLKIQQSVNILHCLWKHIRWQGGRPGLQCKKNKIISIYMRQSATEVQQVCG